MRVAVESWSPDYGSPIGDEALEPSASEVDESVEVPVDEWAPVHPGPDVTAVDDLLFVDGVRRVEAHVWITDDEGQVHQGICASYAAGAVHCRDTASLVSALVERRLLAPAAGADDLTTRHGPFVLDAVTEGDPGDLSLLLQRRMGALEAEVMRSVSVGFLAVVDGPLKPGQIEPGIVGYVKTHRASYGQPIVRDTVVRLAECERTPLVLLKTALLPRFTWYLRLPCPVRHGWAGVVRIEAPALQPMADVAELADRLCLTLGRYASSEQKDPRAPQNLYPVGGLERELRRRLGDPALMFRALREAAHRDLRLPAPAPTAT